MDSRHCSAAQTSRSAVSARIGLPIEIAIKAAQKKKAKTARAKAATRSLMKAARRRDPSPGATTIRRSNAARIPIPISGAATRPASAMAQNRSASSRVPPSASTLRTQTCGTCRSAGTARIACFVSSHIRTVNFMPVINGGGSAEGGSRSTGVAVGLAPLAARSAIRPLTWSGDIDAGNCNMTVAPSGSAAHPTGVTQSRSSSAKARDRAAIAEYLG